MLLTITSTHKNATDLGYLLHKNPARCQSFELSFGRAHVFYPEATAQRCTAALLLDVDPVGLVRNRRGPAGEGFSLEQYVNDRPYVASSFLSVAIAQVLGSALSGKSKDRPELVNVPLPLLARLAVVPCRGEWPRNEQTSVEAFLMAWWLRALETDPADISINDALSAISCAENSIKSYLAAWRVRSTPISMRHLAAIVSENAHCLIKHQEVRGNFWREFSATELIDWLADPQTELSLEKATIANVDAEYSGELLAAAESIRTIRQLLKEQ